MNTKIEICRVISIILLSVFFSACKNHNSESQRVEIAIQAGDGGVIGDVNFLSNPPSFLQTAYDATALLAVHDADGKVVGVGTGIYVKSKNSDNHYILTAAHNLYDFGTEELRGSRITFGVPDKEKKNSVKAIRVKKFPSLRRLDTKFFKTFEDISLVSIYPIEGETPLEFDPDLMKTVSEFDSNIDPKALYSISIVRSADRSMNLKLFQTDFIVEKRHSSPFMFSSLDVAKGMSGSPVIFRDQNKIRIIGVISRMSGRPNCDKFEALKCENTIAYFLN